jgi:hypothetical protein
MTQDCQRRTRKPLLVNLAWVVALVVLLVLCIRAWRPSASPPVRTRIVGTWIDFADEQRGIAFAEDGVVQVLDLQVNHTLTYHFVDEDTVRLSNGAALDLELHEPWLFVHFTHMETPLFSAYKNGRVADFFRAPPPQR